MPLKTFLEQPIAFDADGVLLDFLGSFGKAATAATGRPCNHNGPSYSLEVKFGLTNEELLKTWEIFNTQKYWRNLDPLPGAIESIDKLQSAGFTNIHVVTAIPEQFRADRHANFRKLGFSPEGIHCVEHTTRWAKVPPITALRPFMFIDDRIEHLHSNPQVPLLVHIDHSDEQFPDVKGRIDVSVTSVNSWVEDFIKNKHYWADIAQANSLTETKPAKTARPSIKRPPK